jgi:hypothetical protein
MWPNLAWSDPRRMVSPTAVWVGILTQLVLTVALAAALAIPVGLAYLLGLPPAPLFLAGLVLMGAAAAVVSVACFSIARTRLERLDLSLEAGAGLE